MKIDVNPLKTKRTLTLVLAMLVCSAEASAAGEPVWTLQQTLMASDSEKHDWFGGAVAIEGDTLVVGDGGKTINGGAAVGAVYVFTRSNGVASEGDGLEPRAVQWLWQCGRSLR